MGSMEGGHYTAYCNVRGSGNWYKYDDHEVSGLVTNSILFCSLFKIKDQCEKKFALNKLTI